MLEATPSTKLLSPWTVLETYELAGRHFGFLFRISWPWLLLALCLTMVLRWLVADWIRLTVPNRIGLNALALFLVQAPIHGVCLGAIAVSWHRFLLAPHLGKPPQWWRLVLTYGFIATAIEASLLIWLAMPFAITSGRMEMVPVLLLIFCMPAILYVMARLAFVLPALALERDCTVATALRLTRGNGWQLTGIGVLLTAPIFALEGVLHLTLPTLASGPVSVMFGEIKWFICALLGVIFLSIAYRDLVLRRDASPGSIT